MGREGVLVAISDDGGVFVFTADIEDSGAGNDDDDDDDKDEGGKRSEGGCEDVSRADVVVLASAEIGQ